MNWKQLPLGPLQTNCYILWNQKKECLIFDPGGDGDRLISFIKGNQLKPLAVLLTHAHFDHIGALDIIRSHYEIPAFIHKKEASWLGDPALNGSKFFGSAVSVRAAEQIIKEEGLLNISDFELEVLETPGHSPGSISYYHKPSKAVFSGDALFSGSIGRTDLRGGNQSQLLESIHSKLLSLPEDTYVLSGHGPVTTISVEMDHNPFLNGF
ncbi:MBL fold metallo-hydrolase [Peribacillus acanthi]|uniref:MBL fold metallo-hydrolase n=1 Tax=Peribacillus acanthi TaxID=2171554 RepID=UPI000D3E1FA5|nr:MBL fold metallo-hydrolase [Peribacillus acanthi]